MAYRARADRSPTSRHTPGWYLFLYFHIHIIITALPLREYHISKDTISICTKPSESDLRPAATGGGLICDQRIYLYGIGASGALTAGMTTLYAVILCAARHPRRWHRAQLNGDRSRRRTCGQLRLPEHLACRRLGDPRVTIIQLSYQHLLRVGRGQLCRLGDRAVDQRDNIVPT